MNELNNMNVLGENLQYYRKRKNMTQEQLAEQLEVSRQTVSKWEAGNSYPEMEKILQLCDLFSCSMDTLMRNHAAELEVEDSQEYENHMEKRRRNITIGISMLIAGAATHVLLSGFGMADVLKDTIFMAIAIVAILILIVAGMQDETFRKNHPVVAEFYTREERKRFEEKFPIRIATGIGMILVGLLIGMNGENFPLREGMTEDFYNGVFLFLVAGAVGILVHTGLGKDKYDIAAYNKENDVNVKKANEKVGLWCGCIMLVATILFFVAGFVYDLWDICWIVYPVGGLLCGIVALLLKMKNGN